ncbi:MAG TPA: hypothetical protein PK156_08520 [Polyangium sp.]|nr:hypothetical protein [Polyangium sp.]
MPFKRVFLGTISFVAVVAATGSVTADEPQPLAVAEALFSRGLEDMKAGQFEVACPRIAEAQRMSPTPGTLYTLAECESRTSKIATAVTHYREYLRLYQDLPAEQKRKQESRAKNADAQINTLSAEVPTLALVWPPNPPSGLQVSVDGIRLGPAAMGIEVPMDLGEHMVLTQLPSGEKAEQRVVLAKNEKKRLELELPKVTSSVKPEPIKPTLEVSKADIEAPARPWQKSVGIAAMAVGGAGIAAGAILGGVAITKKNDSNQYNHCDAQDFCDPYGLQLRNEAVALATGSTVALIVGGVLATGGIVLLATAPRASDQGRNAVQGIWNVRLEGGFGSAFVKGTW